MKNIFKIIILIIIIISCGSTNKISTSKEDLYFASKRISESFYQNDSTRVELIKRFLKRDSIGVFIEHSIDDKSEVFYLKKGDKSKFFYKPELFDDEKTRRKSDYYNVEGSCYIFDNEGISHNSIYIKKLCYDIDGENISLKEIYLLDGD